MSDEPAVEVKAEEDAAAKAETSEVNAVVGSSAIRPVFLGNLIPGYSAANVTAIFEEPLQTPSGKKHEPVLVDRIDQKRGFCFVFLKDAVREEDKERAIDFVSELNGMAIKDVSHAVRAEFARGDGRIKRKEDERRSKIQPSDTLFVVNFQEGSTRTEDLKMLFEPFGELLRVDMKRNYAFVQFGTIEQATKAKEATNGGKLDQAVLTVEYVAEGGRRRDSYRGDRGRSRRPPRYDDDDYHRHRGRGGDYHRGRRSPPRGWGRGRSRSRSRSPPRHGYRPRSPPRRYDDRGDRDRYDDYHRGGDRRPPSPRERSPDRDFYRGDRDRGYRG